MLRGCVSDHGDGRVWEEGGLAAKLCPLRPEASSLIEVSGPGHPAWTLPRVYSILSRLLGVASPRISGILSWAGCPLGGHGLEPQPW